jgi:uncharacterized protein (TIGR02246 family)
MAVIIMLALSVTARAAQDGKSDAPALQKIVEQSANRFVEAFKRRDAAAIASLFTEAAEYVDASGMIFHGRSAIQAEFAATFAAGAPGTMQVKLTSIRPIAEGVLVEDGVSSFTPEGGGPASPTRYTATHVKQPDGKWLLASVRELDAGRMTSHARLQLLAWLLGDWHEDVGGSATSTVWKW